jgi:hypothetical protein
MVVKCLLMACDYPGTASELRGCRNDSKNLANALVKSSVAARHDITIVLEPTLEGMRDALSAIARATHDSDVSHVFIAWSGHGTCQPDTNDDEADRMDECLCPTDYDTAGGLVDDELCRIVSTISHNTHVTLLLDCCHSGTAVDLPWVYTGLRHTEHAGKGSHSCHPDVIAISGCKDSQTSADAYDASHNEFTGAMTRAVLDVLEVEPTLIADAPALVAALRVLLHERHMLQVPQLSASQEWSPEADICVLPSPRSPHTHT